MKNPFKKFDHKTIRTIIPYNFRRRGIHAGPLFFDPFSYPDGLVNAVTGGVWNDPSNLLTIANLHATHAAAVNRQQMNHELPATVDMRRAYQFGGRVTGSDFGGLTEIFSECTVADDQSGIRCLVQYTTAGGAIQIDLCEQLANRATVLQAVASPLILGGAAGNNFNVEFNLVISVRPNDSGGVGFRNVRVSINGTNIIDVNTVGNSANLNKRVAISYQYGPTQFFRWNNAFWNQ